MARLILSIVALLIASSAALLGYRFMRADIEAEVYRDRLRSLAEEYESLRDRYNDAVRRGAVTELVVQEGALRVRVRSAEGMLRQIDTPFDPAREIYVDYVVLNGRVWIRRLYDERTAPSDGLLIDPALGEIDWNSANASFGKAVYRRLTDGRWVVTISGDGSLGLRRAGDAEELELLAPPATREFKELEESAAEELRGVGPGEVWDRFFRGNR